MAIQKAEAFVLRAQPFRSSSLLLTLFSRPFGKIKAVAKGVRTEGVARPGTFEPFTLLEIVFYEKIRSEIHLLSEATPLESFEALRRDLQTLATAYYLVELVDQLTEPHDPHEALFELLHFAFKFLPTFRPGFLTRLFEVRLLHETGLMPHLTSCLSCGKKNLDKVFFSIRQGGVYCAPCRLKFPEAKPMSLRVLEVLRFFMEKGISEVMSKPLDRETEKRIKELVERFLADRLGRPLATRRFLSQVESLKQHQ